MSQEHPEISVVIPTYNNASGLRTVLDRLTQQDYPEDEYEVIPVDNNSTDETPNVIREYSSKFPDVLHGTGETQRQGIDAARNRGVKASRGEYIFVTDSDCVPARDWIKEGINGLKSRNALYGGGKIDLYFRNDPPNLWECLDAIRNLDQKQNIENHGFVTGANMFIARSIFDRIGLFDHTVDSGGDVIFGSRVKSQLEIEPIYVPDAVVKHPARSTAGEFLQKTYRTSKGERQLIARGVKERFDGSLRALLPRLTLPDPKNVPLSVPRKLLLLLLTNLLAYLIYLHQCLPITDRGSRESAKEDR